MRTHTRRGVTRVAALLLAPALLAACGPSASDADGPVDPQTVLAEADDVAHVFRSATCECCGAHADHLEEAGFEVVEHVVDDVNAAKATAEIPEQLFSCHTTMIGGYAVEGHVPAESIERMLADAPPIDGIALAGMPAGAPGMPGEVEAPLDVRAFVGGEDSGAVR